MEKILLSVYNSPKKMKLLKIVSMVSAYLSAAFFVVQLATHFLAADYKVALSVGLAAAVGFIVVTVMRKIINLPRPYEVYTFYEVTPRDKKGQSFPSRHCYSAAVIATLGWIFSPLVTVAVGILTVLIAVTRVVTGIHFVRDVLVGIGMGMFFGGVGLTLAYIL